DFFARVFSRIALLPNQVYGSHGRKIVAVPRRCVKSESKQIPRCAWNDKGGISGRTSGVGRPRRRRKRAAPPTLGKESAAGARSGSSGGSRRHCRRGEFSRHRQNTATRAQTVEKQRAVTGHRATAPSHGARNKDLCNKAARSDPRAFRSSLLLRDSDRSAHP